MNRTVVFNVYRCRQHADEPAFTYVGMAWWTDAKFEPVIGDFVDVTVEGDHQFNYRCPYWCRVLSRRVTQSTLTCNAVVLERTPPADGVGLGKL